MVIVRGSLSSSASKVCHTALGTILHHDLQFTIGTKNFTLAERRLKTVTSMAFFYHCYRTKHGQGEVSDEGMKEDLRIAENERRARQFSSFIGKLQLDHPSSPGFVEAQCPLGAPAADRTEEG